MQTYNELFKNCKRQGFDPMKRGKNSFARSWPIIAKKTALDPTKISGFPKRQAKQIKDIGKILNNLISQQKFPRSFTGFKEYDREMNLKNLIEDIHKSQILWLGEAIGKMKKMDKRFELLNGRLFEIDPKKVESINDINKSLAEIRRNIGSLGPFSGDTRHIVCK